MHPPRTGAQCDRVSLLHHPSHIIPRVRSEDEKFIIEQFRRYGPSVYRRARHLLGSAEDAEDVMQDVFLSLAASLGKFDRSGPILNWLYRVTTNRCLDVIRRRRARCNFTFRYRPQMKEQWVPENAIVLQHVLQRCRPEEQQALIYAYCDGLSHDEIARILGVSPRTVGNLLRRAQKRAKKMFADLAQNLSKEPS